MTDQATNSSSGPVSARRRGRPPKVDTSRQDTRQLLVQSGLELFTEQGFSASGLEQILRRVGVPKGSFYHYFSGKEAFGLAVTESYARYYEKRLAETLGNRAVGPMARLQLFLRAATQGMEQHEFRRGCLVGNLGQEVGGLPDVFRQELERILRQWQKTLAACLQDAAGAGELAPDVDCDGLAYVFWVGWEGAVMRARMEKSTLPMDRFMEFFIAALPRR